MCLLRVVPTPPPQHHARGSAHSGHSIAAARPAVSLKRGKCLSAGNLPPLTAPPRSQARCPVCLLPPALQTLPHQSHLAETPTPSSPCQQLPTAPISASTCTGHSPLTELGRPMTSCQGLCAGSHWGFPVLGRRCLRPAASPQPHPLPSRLWSLLGADVINLHGGRLHSSVLQSLPHNTVRSTRTGNASSFLKF